MALSINELNTATQEAKLDKVATDSAYDESVFWAKQVKKGFVTQTGGTTLNFGIHYKKQGTGKSVNPRSQINFANVETLTEASTYWAFYTATAALFWDETVKNAGVSKVIDLAADRIAVLKREILYKLCTDLLSTSTPGGVYDLQPIPYIVDSANTYAGITVADAATWASSEDSSTTTLAVTGSGSLAYYVNACTLGTKAPTLFLTTRNLASKAMSLCLPNQMYSDEETVKLGFANVTLLGIPVVGDGFVTAAQWYGLDMDSWEVVVQNGNGIEYTPWMDQTQNGYKDTAVKLTSFVGQVRCTRRLTNFKYTALDYTK